MNCGRLDSGLMIVVGVFIATASASCILLDPWVGWMLEMFWKEIVDAKGSVVGNGKVGRITTVVCLTIRT